MALNRCERAPLIRFPQHMLIGFKLVKLLSERKHLPPRSVEVLTNEQPFTNSFRGIGSFKSVLPSILLFPDNSLSWVFHYLTFTRQKLVVFQTRETKVFIINPSTVEIDIVVTKRSSKLLIRLQTSMYCLHEKVLDLFLTRFTRANC